MYSKHNTTVMGQKVPTPAPLNDILATFASKATTSSLLHSAYTRVGRALYAYASPCCPSLWVVASRMKQLPRMPSTPACWICTPRAEASLRPLPTASSTITPSSLAFTTRIPSAKPTSITHLSSTISTEPSPISASSR